MDIAQAIKERHSVRAYTGKKIEKEKRRKLEEIIEECNEESGLHIRIRYDDPSGFDSRLAHYGKFRNVEKIISMNEKLVLVIAIGYGKNQGKTHKSRSLESVMATKGKMPDWFLKGAEVD